MTIPDLQFVVHWWLLFLLLSFSVVPLTNVIFRDFFDKGYIFSKSLSLVLLSYGSLLLGTLHILPFTLQSLVALLVIISGINYVSLFHRQPKNSVKKNLATYITKHWKIIVFEELLFLGGIIFLAFIRAHSPDIHGLEKFMDYGFMNSIARSDYFPPKDMWLTPFFINYYYFGHLTGAVLTKLSTIPANISYNLILASVFSLSFVGCFSLGANLYNLILSKTKLFSLKRFLAGMLTALLVTIGGNLHTLYTLFKPYENEKPVPLWNLQFLPASFPNSYWYPNATRFIYNTIHEFPMYSWVVADLHGHVFDIPFVITMLAIFLSFLMQSREPGRAHALSTNHKHTLNNRLSKLMSSYPFPLWHIFLVGFLLSIMYMTNAWDGLIYLLLAGLFFLYIHITRYPQEKMSGLSFLWSKQFVIPLAFSGIVLFICFLVFSLPFSLHFKPFVSGIGVLCAPDFLVAKGSWGPFLFEADHCQRSPWWQLLVLYGFFYFFIFSFLLFLTKVKNVRISDTYVLLLIILGTLLIIIPEFIYVKDIYPAHYRANTMFKLVFQSFILLSIASSYSIVRILTAMRSRKLLHLEKIPSVLFILLTFGMLSMVLMYPYHAINAYYGNLETYSGLKGTTYLDTLYPSDYRAIEWLNDYIPGQPVILEAQGDSYTDFARVSANTGLPTVLGWTVHEWLWRNDYDIPNPPADPAKIYEVPAPRISEIQTLYETQDIQETKRLLKKYHIEYVFVGILEKQKYPTLDEQKWNQLGSLVFRTGATSIYQIK